MSFRTLNDMALDLKTMIEQSNKVLEVRMAAITSYEHLQEVIPSLGKLPAAVVCIGHGDFGNGNDTSVKNVQPGILVVTSFENSAEKKAMGIWKVLDDVTQLFIPQKGMRSAINMNGVIYLPSSFRPIVCDKANSAYLLELKAINAFK